MNMLMSAAKVQAKSNATGSEALINMIFPRRKAILRRLQNQKDNAATFAAFKARRDGAQK